MTRVLQRERGQYEKCRHVSSGGTGDLQDPHIESSDADFDQPQFRDVQRPADNLVL